MATRELRYLVEDLEEETWQALKRSGADMVPYLTKDCVMQFPLGMKLTRDTVPSVRNACGQRWCCHQLSHRSNEIGG
jgi:hypothetical protein